VREFLTSKNTAMVPCPYILQTFPHYFPFFPRIINHLQAHHFTTVESIQTVVTDALKDLTEEDFSSVPRGGRTTSSYVLLLKGNMLKLWQ
jgi:hypothetical protein